MVPVCSLTHVLVISTHPTSGLAWENCTSGEGTSSVALEQTRIVPYSKCWLCQCWMEWQSALEYKILSYFHSKKYRSHFSGNISHRSQAGKYTKAKGSYAWRAYLNIHGIWLQSVTGASALNMERKDKTRLQDGRFFSRGMKGKPWLAKQDCKKKARSCLQALGRIQKIYYVCRFWETCSWQQEDFIP